MSVIYTPRSLPINARNLIFPIVMGLSLVIIGFRLWYFQVVQAADLTAKANALRVTTLVNPAPRGLIYDRNGVLLAGVRSEFVVTAVPAVVAKNQWVLAKVAGMVGVDQKKLADRVEDAKWRPYLPATVFAGASVQVATKIAESGQYLPGIGIDLAPMRFYPDPIDFSHVLGYVRPPSQFDVERMKALNLKSAPLVGKAGVEFVYEKDLMGVPGQEQLEVDNKRRPQRLVQRDAPVAGEQLELALDARLQKLAIKGLSGRPGAAVAIDPRNGEVICLASSPTFDMSLFENGISRDDLDTLLNDPDHPLFARAFQGAYPPGSTFKIVTSLAAMKEGVFDIHRTTFCPGYLMVGKRKIRCLGHHGAIAYKQALVKSCNTYFADLALRAGPQAIREEALACGLYVRSGIDVPGERRGVIPTEQWVNQHRKPAKWYRGDTANMGIGQGEVLATPLQMANLAALVAMDGTNYKPHIVRAMRQSKDEQWSGVQAEVAHRVDAPDWFWHVLKDAMVTVVSSGTAQRARINGLSWAGKTGSAEIRGQHKTDGWFVGYAPAENPRIAICVMVEDAGHGGDVAAPLAKDIVATYLGLDKPAKTPAKMPSALPASPNAPRSINR